MPKTNQANFACIPSNIICPTWQYHAITQPQLHYAAKSATNINIQLFPEVPVKT